MRRARFLRSTPFRLALTFGFLFIAAFLVTGIVTYQLLFSGLARQLDDTVNGTYSVVAATYAQNDVEDLVAAVNVYSGLHQVASSVFSLEDSEGKRLAGNFSAPKLAEGLSTVQAAALGLSEEGAYRVKVGTVGGNRLVVGQSFAEMRRMAAIMLKSFGWAAGFVVVIAIGGGVFLAMRAQSRLDAVARTMLDVSNGELTTRIPLNGNGDDIDLVSSQINHALDRLAGLVEGMRQVSADIAHELKTPLNRLRMMLDDAAERHERGEAVGGLIAEAQGESDQINATFEALLRISQIEAGARRTRFGPVDLAAILASLAEIYGSVAEDSGHTLQLTLPDNVPATVIGDQELLTQMFANLIENAINYCPAGSRIDILQRLEQGKAVAVIADNGPGIPVDERENVFRRLYRLDKSRTTSGSGLGLSLVRAIADLHGAELVLEDNDPGLRVLIRMGVS